MNDEVHPILPIHSRVETEYGFGTVIEYEIIWDWDRYGNDHKINRSCQVRKDEISYILQLRHRIRLDSRDRWPFPYDPVMFGSDLSTDV